MMGWIFPGILVFIALAPVIAWLRRSPMDEAACEDAPGEFAQLPGGKTHYQWHGEGDDVAVCVHGLTTPSYVWGAIVQGLVAQSYRVLTYDLYGRGYSDRVAGAQDAKFFNRQLQELLADQGVEGSITLLGYSMGGAIVTCFGTTHPEMVKRLILLAPAGFRINPTWVQRFIMKVPILGDWLMLVTGGASLRRGVTADSRLAASVPDIYALQTRETWLRGFLPAVLSSYRNLLSATLEPEHLAVAKAGIPLAAIWGGGDSVIPISGRDALAVLNPTARQTVIPNAPHSLAYTYADEVNAAIEEFLGEG